MLLPPSLFEPIARHIPHHRIWHRARLISQGPLRATLPGECRATLAALNEAGSGCDFLAFHRRMMRHFAFVLAAVKYEPFNFETWPGDRLPPWVEAALAREFPGFDLQASYAGIDAYVAAGDVESLGGFVEANDLMNQLPGSGLHGLLHLALDAVECEIFCGDTTSRMKDLGSSPGNVLFWLLHKWIDDRYYACQLNAGDTPNRSPLEMHDHVHRATKQDARED